MSLELSIAIVAVVVSLVSFVVNWYSTNEAERHKRMPVLVAQIGKDRTIVIQNIGSGPALNIVIADAMGELASRDVRKLRLSRIRYLSRRRYKDRWEGYMHLSPIPADGQRRYVWDVKGAVGFSYTDALGAKYTTLSSQYGTRQVDGAIMPDKPLHELEYPDER